jgi:hypothetical protein
MLHVSDKPSRQPSFEILEETTITCCGNPEGFGISNPVDKRLSKAIAQAKTLATYKDSVLAGLEFPTPRTSPVALPAPVPPSTKPLAPLIGGITLVTKNKWSAWTGGKPNRSWTGLDGSVALIYLTKQTLPRLAEVHIQLYDKTNNMASKAYLRASLSTGLSNKVTENLDNAESFPVVWLQFLKSIQSTSIEGFEDLKTTIKASLPSWYSGENLEQLAAHLCKDANDLTTAAQYDHNLPMSMLKIFLLAGYQAMKIFVFP